MKDDKKSNTNNDIEHIEKAFLTSEVAKMLGMATTTIRKYSQSLEGKGYIFIKGKGAGKRQARLYTEKDISVLRHLTEVRKEKNLTVDRATSIVIERFEGEERQDTLTHDTAEKTDIERYNKQLDELKEMIKKQSELLLNQSKLILSLTERLDKQENHLKKQTKAKFDKSTEYNETEVPKEEKKKGLFRKRFKNN